MADGEGEMILIEIWKCGGKAYDQNTMETYCGNIIRQ